MNSPFVTKELEDALTMLKLRKGTGPDNITNEMLLHLGPCSKKKLLQLFNDGWRTGTVPQVWREAIMIPILKRSKDKSQAESYRPISLTSCVGKLMERLINTRLMWHLEDKNASRQSKQLLGKIGLLRIKSPISPKQLKMPSKTRSTHLQYGLT